MLLLVVLELLLEDEPVLEELLEVPELEALDVLLVELELLLDEDEELLLDELELDSSSPWVTNKPSAPQALSAAITRHRVRQRRDFVAVVRKPEEDIENTPYLEV